MKEMFLTFFGFEMGNEWMLFALLSQLIAKLNFLPNVTLIIFFRNFFGQIWHKNCVLNKFWKALAR